MARQKMTSRKKLTPAQKYERLDRQYSDFTAGSISIHSAWVGFIAEQITKGNSKATIDFYNRFYKKLKAYLLLYFFGKQKEGDTDKRFHFRS